MKISQQDSNLQRLSVIYRHRKREKGQERSRNRRPLKTVRATDSLDNLLATKSSLSHSALTAGYAWTANKQNRQDANICLCLTHPSVCKFLPPMFKNNNTECGYKVLLRYFSRYFLRYFYSFFLHHCGVRNFFSLIRMQCTMERMAV